MINRKLFCLILLICCLLAVSCTSQETNSSSASPASTESAQSAPKITLSADKIHHKQWITMKGSGFTPQIEALSHLRRPNGTEFPTLPILTDAKGEFTHEIDSLLLIAGTHELWVFDGKTGVSSNVAKFDVDFGQDPVK